MTKQNDTTVSQAAYDALCHKTNKIALNFQPGIGDFARAEFVVKRQGTWVHSPLASVFYDTQSANSSLFSQMLHEVRVEFQRKFREWADPTNPQGVGKVPFVDLQNEFPKVVERIARKYDMEIKHRSVTTSSDEKNTLNPPVALRRKKLKVLTANKVKSKG